MLFKRRISINPKIMHGKACIKGTRIPVYLVLEMLATGETFDGILTSYPSLKKQDINASIEYAAETVKEEAFSLRIVPKMA